MKGLEKITKLYNEFACSAIEIRYGSNTKADIKPISEKLKEAIDQFSKELEDEKRKNRLKLCVSANIPLYPHS